MKTHNDRGSIFSVEHSRRLSLSQSLFNLKLEKSKFAIVKRSDLRRDDTMSREVIVQSHRRKLTDEFVQEQRAL